MTSLVVIVWLMSELPDPGRIGTITFAGGVGAFVGALVAHLRRLPSGIASDMTRVGMLIGFGIGLIGWLVVFAIYRL